MNRRNLKNSFFFINMLESYYLGLIDDIIYNLTTVCILLLYHVEHHGICIEHSFKSSDIFKGVGATF